MARPERCRHFMMSGGLDVDAAAFLAAQGNSDATQSAAINALVVGLKADSLWTKIYAAYPMVGGTASMHKWNLKDPRDLDAAFRLTFTGGITHDANGMQGNGSTGLADTKFNASTNGFTGTSGGLAVHIRNDAASGYDMGSSDSAVAKCTDIAAKYTGGTTFYAFHSSAGGAVSTTNTDSRGFHLIQRNAGSIELYKAGYLVNTGGVSSASGLSTNTVYLGAENRGGSAIEFSTHQYMFALICDTLTATQVALLKGRLLDYQVALGRLSQYLARWKGYSSIYSDAGTTPVTVDGTAIYRIGDVAAVASYPLDQTTLGNRPLYKTGQTLSGKGVARYDGSDDYSVATLNGTKLGKLTVGLVCRPLDTASTKGIWAWQSGLTSGTPFILFQRDSTNVKVYVDAGYRFTVPHATTDFAAYVLNYDGTNWNLYVNGVAQTPYTGGLAQQSDATGIYQGNGLNGYANVDIMESVVYDYVYDPALLSADLKTLAGL